MASAIALWLCCLPLASGCGERGDRIEVRVCSDAALPGELDAIRVVILNAEREELRSATRQLVLCPQDQLLTLPQTIEFEGAEVPDAWVLAQGLKDGVVVIWSERRVTLERDVIEQLTVALERACVGVQCSLGQACVAGACEIVSLDAPEEALCRVSEPSEPAAEKDDERDDEAPRHCIAPL